MILPTKHTPIEQSLIGFGGYLLEILKEKYSIDTLWKKYQDDLKKKVFIGNHSFDNMLLTLVLLYSLGIIEEKDGVIKRCNY